MDNSTILIIPDIQAPFNHPDTIPFLKEIKKSFKPTRVIQGGDLYDFHCFSDYNKNPNLMGTQEEIIELKKFISEIGKVFPVMDILDSNHGNRIRRKANNAGLPDSFLKDEMDIIGAPVGWKLHKRLLIKTNHGNEVLLVHNYSSNVLLSSKDMACSLIQFHYHSKYETHYWSNGSKMFFATTSGCLIDPNSSAFSYNFTQSKRPCLGAIVLKGMSVIHIPMITKKDRWVGYL